MANRPKAGSIDEYIAGFPPETQEALASLRGLINSTVPGAIETISYAIPTFDLEGRHLVHFAGYQHHIGFYPTPSGIDAFREELTSFKCSKGAVQFPLGEPLPEDLIRRMVEFRVKEERSRRSK